MDQDPDRRRRRCRERGGRTEPNRAGNDLAFAPAMQGNIAIRKEWGMSSGNMGHFQGQLTWSDDSYSDIIEPNKGKQASYSFMNLRAGISNDMWLAEIYIDNVTDERAEISNNFVFDRLIKVPTEIFCTSFIRGRVLTIMPSYYT